MFVKERFQLSSQTLTIINNMKPKFGFGAYGETVFYTRYSRLKKTGGRENWADVVTRCIEGVMSIRKDWYVKSNLYFDESYWQELALSMAVSMFNFEWLPPGRGLWAMGTDFVYERGSMALQNCGFSIIGDNIGKDVYWCMDALMCGVGVGFMPDRDDGFVAYVPSGSYKHDIEDSREGWCKSVKALIDSYVYGAEKPIFNYSYIRPEGVPIKGFGGVASGPAPLKLLHDRIDQYFSNYLNNPVKYDTVRLKADILNAVGATVIAGNVRRSAEIACGEIYDDVFMDLKDYNRYPERADIGWMSNNSAYLRNKSDYLHLGEIAKRVVDRGEPGLINYPNLKYGRIGKFEDNVKHDNAQGFNPCVTGDTLVYTVNGYKPFVELAEAGIDVDVFCISDDDNIVVKRMRNPRKTGIKVPVYKITLDSGDVIHATLNHKFILRNGDHCQVKDLKPGDSLTLVNTNYPKVDLTKDTYWSHYVHINYKNTTYQEHRIIANAYEGQHVHHIDGNKRNNSPENLEVLDAFDHLSKHAEGENNANYSGWSDADFYYTGIELCKKLGRRFSCEDWKKRGYPQSDSYYRQKSLGSFSQFSMDCARLAKVNYIDLDQRTIRHIAKLKAMGYEVLVENGEVFVVKHCEVCKQKFARLHTQREVSYCSMSCANVGKTRKRKVKDTSFKDQQIKNYVDLKFELGRKPSIEEWRARCRATGVTTCLGPKYPFKNYGHLKAQSLGYNHKVVSVEYVYDSDVYNGTVDDYHNYIIGGWKETLKSGSKVIRGVATVNCGEQPLFDKELCTLVETIPTRCKDKETWLKSCEYATIYAQTVTLLPTHSPETNAVMMKNRRIGVSIMDYTGMVHNLSQSVTTRWLRDGYQTVRHTAKSFAEQSGVPEPIRVTTVKPGGTTPKLAGVTAGSGYPNFHEMLRLLRLSATSDFAKLLVDSGVPYEKDLSSMNTLVFEFPILQGPAEPVDQVSLWQQACNMITLQSEWSDNAVSNTLMFKPKWPVIGRYTYTNDVERSTILRVLTQQHNIDFEAGLNTKSSYEFNGYKIVEFNEYGQTGFNLCKFDPHHEEDIIEKVLSFCLPYCKSLSLLPHSAKGVYAQSPEQGLTKEEYNERVKNFPVIDWSKLGTNDDVVDGDKYCSGASCEI